MIFRIYGCSFILCGCVCTSCNTTSLTLNWTAVENAEGYQVYKLDENNKPVKIATVGASPFTYTDTLGTPATKAKKDNTSVGTMV